MCLNLPAAMSGPIDDLNGVLIAESSEAQNCANFEVGCHNFASSYLDC